MRIITHACPTCGTVVAANELERRRVMRCPGLDCDTVLRFEDLDTENREFFMKNRDQYHL
ncbi:hypothetical protein [Natronomonas aquatica]|uniref:hypothetical protein n=1 Tax=Natronomonas aquatica TaxID=2841590 RepID=UPI003AEFB05C